jgi:hypothetical protein
MRAAPTAICAPDAELRIGNAILTSYSAGQLLHHSMIRVTALYQAHHLLLWDIYYSGGNTLQALENLNDLPLAS